jgi:uncharacterized protein (DUF4415 family)
MLRYRGNNVVRSLLAALSDDLEKHLIRIYHRMFYLQSASKMMKNEYDFSKGKRGALISSKGKTRITIYLDDSILEEFRTRAENAGTGYQTLINDALKEYLSSTVEKPVTESVLRRVLHESLRRSAE